VAFFFSYFIFIMSLDYEQVWTVMNDVDEVITQLKIVEQMLHELNEKLCDECDSDEILNSAMCIEGVASYMQQKLENSHIKAWNSVVVPLHKQEFSSKDTGKGATVAFPFRNDEKTGVIDLS
tara:strand:- start:83 stop:448 length:366 start_codon:yes stop_codon:yes gene_type:complete